MTQPTPDLRARQLDRVLADAAAWHDRLRWTRPEIEAHQQRLLRRLLAHAIERSPFHAARLAGIDPSTCTLADLHRIPVMTKAEMMADFDRVVTDPRITRAAAEAHVAAAGPELRHLHDHVVMASGGSSGVRGLFAYDDEGLTSFALTLVRDTLHTVRSLGVTGDQPVTGAIVAAGATVHATAVVAQLAGAAPSPVRMQPVPATLPFEEVLARLEEIQPISLIAYGSMLRRLAAAKRDGRLSIAPFAVSSTSEAFTADDRAEVEQAFGVPAGNTFGSTEGLVGLAPPGHDAIRFAEDTCIVELVDEAGHPVPPGTTSAKVYVTNLTNLAQPLLRYELTDRMRQVSGDWPDGYLRAVVDGRSDDQLVWGSVTVHPLVVRSVLVHHAGLVEHQVHQTPRGIDVAVVLADDRAVPLDTLATELKTALAGAGLPDAEVAIRPVPAVERDPASGKIRRVVGMSARLTEPVRG